MLLSSVARQWISVNVHIKIEIYKSINCLTNRIINISWSNFFFTFILLPQSMKIQKKATNRFLSLWLQKVKIKVKDIVYCIKSNAFYKLATAIESVVRVNV